MEKNNRERYEDLFAFMRDRLPFGTRLDFEVDELLDYYYFHGSTLKNEFNISIYEDVMELSFDHEDSKYEEELTKILSEFNQDEVAAKYSIRDMNDPKSNIKSYIWTNSKEKIEDIKQSNNVEFPYYTADVVVLKEQLREKQRKI